MAIKRSVSKQLGSLEKRLSQLGELRVIDFIRRYTKDIRNNKPISGRALTGIGDDCAVIEFGAGWRKARKKLLLTTDTFVENVHFRSNIMNFAQVGYRAVMGALSDIAAMGGKPLWLLLTICWPSMAKFSEIRQLYDGILKATREYSVAVVGGDTVSSQERVVTITVLGEANVTGSVMRAGARPGDDIWLAGAAGDAAAGLKILTKRLSGCKSTRKKKYISGMPAEERKLMRAFLEPKPQLKLGRLLASRKLVTAMIDTSDGVAAGVSAICQESNVGAKLEAELLMPSTSLAMWCKHSGHNPLQFMLAGGEDYGLVFTSPPSVRTAVSAVGRRITGTRMRRIGTIVAHPLQPTLIRPDGRPTVISSMGWDHWKN